MIFYESPHRLSKTLEQFCEYFGKERYACVSREISKLHEEHRRGTLAELAEYYRGQQAKGEIVITVAGLGRKKAKEDLVEKSTPR